SLRVPSSALRFRPPAELTVVGDVGKGKGGKNNFKDFVKDGSDAKSGDSKESTDSKSTDTKETSKAVEKSETAKETTVAENGNGDGKGKRNRFNGDANVSGSGSGRGNFDISQFRGPDGKIDREKLAEFRAKNGGGNGSGKGFDPSQFKGRNNN